MVEDEQHGDARRLAEEPRCVRRPLERLLASHAFLRGASPEEIDALEAALVKRKSPTHDVTVKVSKRQPQQQTLAEVSVDFAHGRDPRVARAWRVRTSYALKTVRKQFSKDSSFEKTSRDIFVGS